MEFSFSGKLFFHNSYAVLTLHEMEETLLLLVLIIASDFNVKKKRKKRKKTFLDEEMAGNET